MPWRPLLSVPLTNTESDGVLHLGMLKYFRFGLSSRTFPVSVERIPKTFPRFTFESRLERYASSLPSGDHSGESLNPTNRCAIFVGAESTLPDSKSSDAM